MNSRSRKHLGIVLETRDTSYRYVIVESFVPSDTSGKHGPVHIRPLGGQGLPNTLFVSCSKRTRDLKKYPLGTKFKIMAKLTDGETRGEYLYSRPQDPIVVVSELAAVAFTSALAKGDI